MAFFLPTHPQETIFDLRVALVGEWRPLWEPLSVHAEWDDLKYVVVTTSPHTGPYSSRVPKTVYTHPYLPERRPPGQVPYACIFSMCRPVGGMNIHKDQRESRTFLNLEKR